MASIYLIRHGQARFGTEDYDRLSELGARQARRVGEYLALADIRIDAVYSGELQRQRHTAELACAHCCSADAIRIDARLNEIDNDGQVKTLLPPLLEKDPGLREHAERAGKSSKDYQKVLQRVFEHWVRQDRVEGLQSWPDFSHGVREVLRDIVEAEGSGKNVAVFSSGGTIATMVAQVLGLGGEETYRFYEPMINCSITRLLYSADRVSLFYFNDHSFLDVLGGQSGESLVSFR